MGIMVRMNTTAAPAYKIDITPGLPSFSLVWADGTPAYGPYATASIRDAARHIILTRGDQWPPYRITVEIPNVSVSFGPDEFTAIADAITAANIPTD